MAEHSERLHVFKVRAGSTKFDANAFEKIAKRRKNKPAIIANEEIAKAVAKNAKSSSEKPDEIAATNFAAVLTPSVADSHPLDFEREYDASFSVGKPQKPAPSSRKAAPRKAVAFSRNLSSNLPIENLRQYHMPFRKGRPKELNRFVRDNHLLSRACDFVNRFELDLSNQSHLDRLESLLEFEFGKNALTSKSRVETVQEPEIKQSPIEIPVASKPQARLPFEKIRARRIASGATAENEAAAEDYRKRYLDSEGNLLPSNTSKLKSGGPIPDYLKACLADLPRKPRVSNLEKDLEKVFTRVVRIDNGMHPNGSRGWVNSLMKTDAAHQAAGKLLATISSQHKIDSSMPQNERKLVELLSAHALQTSERKSEWEALLRK